MSARYRAFGLGYRSDIELPFAEDDDGGPADVEVVRAAVPDRLDQADGGARAWSARPGAFLLNDALCGRLHVTGGSRMAIALTDPAQMPLMLSYVLGSGTAALLQQRGLLALHASAVALGGGAVALAGASGAGKSTLLAEFLRRGRAALSDDILALDVPAAPAPLARPGYPQQKLWKDTLDRTGRSPTGFSRVSGRLDKFYVPVARFHPTPLPLRAIFCLQVGIGAAPGCTRLTGGEAHAELVAASYRRRILMAQGLARQHFGQIARLVRSVPVFRLMRGEGADSARALCDMVEDAAGTPA